MYSFLIKCPNVNIVVYGNLMVESNLYLAAVTMVQMTAVSLSAEACVLPCSSNSGPNDSCIPTSSSMCFTLQQ